MYFQNELKLDIVLLPNLKYIITYYSLKNLKPFHNHEKLAKLKLIMTIFQNKKHYKIRICSGLNKNTKFLRNEIGEINVINDKYYYNREETN